MEKRINLIPRELTVPVLIVKLTRLINKVSLVLLILLITLSLGFIIYIFYFSSNLKKIDASVVFLKQEISSLEKVEQQLILTKDKLSKIATVMSFDSVNNSFKGYKDIKEMISFYPDIEMSEVEIDSKKVNISIVSNNTDSFLEFLKQIPNVTGFSSISISSLSYSSKSGFSLNIAYGI